LNEIKILEKSLANISDTLNLYTDSLKAIGDKFPGTLKYFTVAELEKRKNGERVYQRLTSAYSLLEQRYIYLLEKKTEKSILAVGQFYNLYVLEHARYRSGKEKNF